MKLPPTFSQDKQLVNVIVETPRGSSQKYNYNPESDLFFLKKTLPPQAAFPLDFGFIPGTLAEDGDALDALLLADEPTFPGCLVACRIIGSMPARQTKPGQTAFFRNDRIMAVSQTSRKYAHLQELDEMDHGFLECINQFFTWYHREEGCQYETLPNQGAAMAMERVAGSC